MPGPRDYTQATRASLAMLSQGKCYAPDCEASLIVVIGDEPYPDFQIAHIYDANPGGRYLAGMSDDDRRSFRNLILLCKPHHDLIDKRHPEQYPADLLLEWKRTRETTAMEDALSQVHEDELEAALTEAAIVVQNSVIHLGGQGGAAPGAGGGGGGVLGSGRGGNGGRGGDIINLDGAPATAPGAGGGGAGTDIPNGYGGEGGGGGDVLTAWIRADEFESLDITVGEGGTDGRDGGDTVVILRDQDGVERDRLVAQGGVAGRSGGAVCDETEGPALSISSIFLANSAEVRGGLIYVLGGGWTAVRVQSFPATIVFPLVLIAEARHAGERDTELLIQVVDATGTVLSEEQVPCRVNPQLLPDRFPIALGLPPVVADDAGVWTIRVESGGVELATTTVRVQLTDPSPQP